MNLKNFPKSFTIFGKNFPCAKYITINSRMSMNELNNVVEDIKSANKNFARIKELYIGKMQIIQTIEL
jgi:hypothetical protein